MLACINQNLLKTMQLGLNLSIESIVCFENEENSRDDRVKSFMVVDSILI